jgi:SAM-dependent methyltransferase
MSKWPKKIVELTEEQKRIGDDWLKYWLEMFPEKYSAYAKFNHEFVTKSSKVVGGNTLEIGCGDGEHLKYEGRDKWEDGNYYAVDIRKNVLDVLSKKYEKVNCVLGDCQQPLGFEEGFFNRVLAIHVLEHLPNLPAALFEIHRLLNKKNGIFQVVLPCEGGLAYTIARKISSERLFKKRYGISYDWYMESEHINSIDEVQYELSKLFAVTDRTYFPLRIPVRGLNLAIGLNLSAK